MDVRKVIYSWWDDDVHSKLSDAESCELHAAMLSQWRHNNCCTRCGHFVAGNVDVLDEQGVNFFGPPHVVGDRICFWCFESEFWQPDTPSRWQWGRA